jgi:hypothetical protein
MLRKKIWANFQRIIELFTQKIVTKLSKIWVRDPRSGIQGSKRHRIQDPDPQHWQKNAKLLSLLREGEKEGPNFKNKEFQSLGVGRLNHGRGGAGQVRRVQDGVPPPAAQRVLRLAQGGGVVPAALPSPPQPPGASGALPARQPAPQHLPQDASMVQ